MEVRFRFSPTHQREGVRNMLLALGDQGPADPWPTPLAASPFVREVFGKNFTPVGDLCHPQAPALPRLLLPATEKTVWRELLHPKSTIVLFLDISAETTFLLFLGRVAPGCGKIHRTRFSLNSPKSSFIK